MGGIPDVKDLVKPPFANYDIVVYFGAGVFSVPLINRYALNISSKKFPAIFSGYSDPFINNSISIIALLFGIYIIGHGIALLSSLFIEQFLYRTVGTPSSIIIESAKLGPVRANQFRKLIRMGIIRRYYRELTFSDVARLIFQIPVIPIYLFIYTFGLYGFYESKISDFIVIRVQSILEKNYDYSGSVISDKSWFKIVEYCCANDHPSAMLKMYNYLVIYGLFRSISFIVLCCFWSEIFFWFFTGGLGFLDQKGHGSMIFRCAVLSAAYFVSFVGFAKFSRRYSEEAIQAFGLSRVFKEAN